MIKVEKENASYEGTGEVLLGEYVVATNGLIETLMKLPSISQTQAKLLVMSAFKIGMGEE